MIEQFKEWIHKNQVEKRTIEGFWEAFHNYKIEEPEEYTKNFGNSDTSDLHLELNRISLNLRTWPLCVNNTVSAHIPIYGNNKYVGYYEMVFSFDGTAVDDYFVTY